VLISLKQREEALQAFQKALEYKEDFAEAYDQQGRILSKMGRLEEAAEKYQLAIQHRPDFADAYNNLGIVMKDLRRYEEAISCYQNALRYQPDFIQAYNNLGWIMLLQGQSAGAIKYLSHALRLDPNFAQACNNMGIAHSRQGNLTTAQKFYQQALQHQPDFAAAHSNLLFLQSYNLLCKPQEMLAAHQAWDLTHGGGPDRAQTFCHAVNDDPDRRLRIGYVSPDFKHHAVSYFFEPLLKAHDRRQVEVFCYAEVNNPDTVTQRLRDQADHWRSTVGMSDEALARRIHDDRIDLLIDLAGHTAGNRLMAFTYKPAPVQATYLGYFTTTGLATMDYWITDEILTPPDTVELAAETLYRLPRCCLAYQAAAEAPEVVEPDNAHITFGSFNQLSKMSPGAVAPWSEVLKAVPQSRLLLKTTQLADAAVADRVRQQFSAQDIDPARLLLLSATASYREHMAVYGQVDIALDTVPRTGGSTTADALWMGVPVITLAGERFIERLSASMLHSIDLDELITHSREEYVACASTLAEDHERRRKLRASLRQRMANSPLCNPHRLARALELAYRQMWCRFLKQPTHSA